VVDDDRQQESLIGSHKVRPVNCELPFRAEVSLDACVRILGDDRNKESTAFDLLADRSIPGVPAPKLALVEPDLDSGVSQACADPLSRRGIFRGVAQKYRPGRCRPPVL